MSKNIVLKIVGYSDEDGFTYCIKHAVSKSESIFENLETTSFEKCCICGEHIDDFTRTGEH